MKNKHYYIIRCIIVLCSLPFILTIETLQAQEQLAFSVIDATKGLSDNQIRYIQQLPDGRLAIATSGNMNLYDGAHFQYIHRGSTASFPLPRYKGLLHQYLSNDSMLWIKNTQELMLLNLRKGIYVPNINQIFHSYGIKDKVEDLYIDTKQGLWMVTERDELFYQPASKRKATRFLSQISFPEGLQHPQISLQDIAIADGDVFLFYQNGLLLCYDIKTGKERYRSRPYNEKVAKLYEAGTLVVPGPKGFYQHREGKRGILLFFNRQTHKWITLLDTEYWLNTLAVEPAHRKVWLTYAQGMWSFDLGPDSLPLNRIHNYATLRLINGQVINTEVSTIFRDRQDGLWVGTANRGLMYYHPARFKLTQIGRAAFPEKSNRNIYVSGFAEDAQGNIYLRSGEANIYKYQPNAAIQLLKVAESSLSKEVQTKLRATPSTNFEGHTYTALLTDSRGWTWAGTPDGLKLRKGKNAKWTTLYAEDGLVNNSIHAILEDRKHQVWVSTSNGLSRINISNSSLSFSNYDLLDGAIEGEYADGSVFQAKNGTLFFGGLEGFNVLPHGLNRLSSVPLTPLFTSFYLQGIKIKVCQKYHDRVLLPQTEPYTKQMTLEYDQNFFTLGFSALNYINPAQCTYRYQLVGVDATWREEPAQNNGMLLATYTDLSPGTYRFRVCAVDNGLQWNKAPITELAITILAPWWATSWAYFFYCLVSIGSIAGTFYLYLQYSKRKLERKHKEDILLLRIKSLMEQLSVAENQKPEHSTFLVSSSMLPSSEENIGTDSKANASELVSKAIQLIEKNLNNSSYSVEQLAHDLYMDRTGLYRKLTAALDKTPTLFIRSIRLKRAAALLCEEKYSISEIADLVGFSTSSYLSKCFQEEYGCKPSEYVKKIRGEITA